MCPEETASFVRRKCGSELGDGFEFVADVDVLMFQYQSNCRKIGGEWFGYDDGYGLASLEWL